MHLNRIPYKLAIILLIVASSSIHAEDPAARSAKEINFSCVVWQLPAYPEIFYRQGEEFRPLKLLPRQRSPNYQLQAREALELYVASNQPDGKPGHQLVGKASLPQGTNQMLFMIQEAANGAKLPLTVFGVDDSLSSFPIGSFRFLNFTKFPLQVEFGGSTNKLPPQAIKVVKPEIPELGGFLPFFIKDLNDNIGFQTRLFAQPRGRKMVLIVPPAKKGENLAVLFLPQIIPLEQ